MAVLLIVLPIGIMLGVFSERRRAREATRQRLALDNHLQQVHE